jgi:hypothetical protein
MAAEAYLLPGRSVVASLTDSADPNWARPQDDVDAWLAGDD